MATGAIAEEPMRGFPELGYVLHVRELDGCRDAGKTAVGGIITATGAGAKRFPLGRRGRRAIAALGLGFFFLFRRMLCDRFHRTKQNVRVAAFQTRLGFDSAVL